MILVTLTTSSKLVGYSLHWCPQSLHAGDHVAGRNVTADLVVDESFERVSRDVEALSGRDEGPPQVVNGEFDAARLGHPRHLWSWLDDVPRRALARKYPGSVSGGAIGR